MWHWSLPILQKFQPFKILYVLRFSSPKVPSQISQLDIATVDTFLNSFFLPYLSHRPNAQNFHHMTIFGETCTTIPGESHRVSWTMKKWQNDTPQNKGVSPQGVKEHPHLWGAPGWCWGQRTALRMTLYTSVLWQNVRQILTRELWQVRHSHLMNPPPLTQAPESATEPGLPYKKKHLWQPWASWCARSGLPRSGHNLLEEKSHLHVATKVTAEPKTTASQSNSSIK